MKKMITKTDRIFLDLLTEYIKRWIAKKEYKKHKIDFMISSQWLSLLNLSVLALGIPAMLYVVEGKIWMALFHALIWATMAGFHGLRIQRDYLDTKVWYDQLFAMRKNPQYYQMHKEVLEELFVKSRRRRYSTLGFLVGITILVVALLSMLAFAAGVYTDVNTYVSAYLLINCGLSVLQSYIFYVFDFDEPKPKEKRERASLTKIALREWKNLIGGLNPVPQI